MNIVVVNGEPDASSDFERYVREFVGELSAEGNNVAEFTLRDMNLRGCTGCFGCWVKTPGECVQRDGGELLCRTAINSDLVVWTAPIVMGYPSALAKRSVERMIPLLHPFVEIEGGEMHHGKRYERYPDVGLIVSAGPDEDAEDIEITRKLWARMARDFKAEMRLFAVADRSPKEVAHELAATA